MAVKFRLAMGASASTMAIVEGTAIAGGNAVEVNYDFDRMPRHKAINLLRKVRREIIRGDWPAGEVAPDPDPDPGDVAPLGSRTVSDAAWSWHIGEQAVFDATRNRIYKGATSIRAETGDVGAQWVLEFGANGEYLTRHLVNTGYVADDHNAPALLIHDGRLIIGIAGHNDGAHIKMGWSSDTNPANIGALTTLNTTQAATYVQFIVLGSTIYAFTRNGSNRWMGWANTAGGDPEEWGAGANVLESSAQNYQAARASGEMWAAILWDHPTQESEGRGLIRVMEKEDPFAGDPVDINECPILYTPPEGDSSRVFSVNEDCTQFLYGTFTVGANGPCAYHLARLTGPDRTDPADWTHEVLGAGAASPFLNVSAYYAGGEVVGSGAGATTLWLACDAGGFDYSLEHWTRPDAGSQWTKTTVAQSNRRLARPVAVRGKADAALVQTMNTYVGFTNFNIDAFSAVGIDADDYPLFPNMYPPYADTLHEDKLNDENGTLLTNHTPDMGGPWLQAAGEMSITNDRLHNSGGSTASSVALLGGNLPEDVAIYGDMYGQTISGIGGIVLRADDAMQNYVQFVYNASGPEGGGFYLYEIVNGSASVLDFHVVAFSSGTRRLLHLITEGQEARGFVDGVEVVSAELSNPYDSDAAKGGIRLVGGSATTRFHMARVGVGLLL